MFSKAITESDIFLDMPLTTQALYFHLGMQADDDGFVSPNRILRMIGCQPDDLKVLITKNFVIPFESGVYVITHWKENNYIQSDRKKITLYSDELSKLKLINGVYNLDTKCIQDVHVGEYSIVKDSIIKEEKSKVKYAENVTLTEDQYNKLLNQFGEKLTIEKINDLSYYKCSKGKKYKSDYHTILNWNRKDEKEKNKISNQKQIKRFEDNAS